MDAPAIESILDSIPEAIIRLDDDLNIESLNLAAGLLFGLQEEDAIGKSLETIIPGQYASLYRDRITKGWEGREIRHFKLNGKKPDNQEFTCNVSINRLNYDGRHLYTLVLKNAAASKKEYSESEERYRGLIESQTDLIVRVDLEGRFTFANQAYCAKFDRPLDTLIGQKFSPLVHPDDLPNTLRAMEGLYAPPYRITVEQRAMTKEGWRWFAWEDSAIRNENGSIYEIQAVGRDITPSKQDHLLLLAQRDLAQALAGISSLDEALRLCLDRIIQESGLDSGGIYLVNPATGDLELAYSQGLSPQFAAAAHCIPSGSGRWKLAMNGQPVYTNYQLIFDHTNPVQAEEKLQALAIVPVSYHGSVVACFNLASHTLQEVSPMGKVAALEIALQVGNAIVRIQAEKGLTSKQNEMIGLFDSIQDMLFILDEQGTIIQVNQQVLNYLGFSKQELLGKPVTMVHPPELRQEAATVIQEMVAGQSELCQLDLMTRNGMRIPVETKVSPGMWDSRPVLIGISRNIIDRVTSQQTLEYRSRFEDMLTHISTRFISPTNKGIDHEINAALNEIGLFEHVDRSYVFILDHERRTMSNTHEWCAHGIEPQIDYLQNLDWDIFPWWMAKLQNFEPIHTRQVATLPDEAGTEKAILMEQNIVSVAVIPLVFGKELLGFVGLDSVRIERDWNYDSISLLTIFANVLSNAIKRKQIENELKQAQSRSVALLNAIPDIMMRFNADGTILDFAASDPNELAVAADQVIGGNLMDILGPELGAAAIGNLQTAIYANQTTTMEYNLVVASGAQSYEARFVRSGNNEAIAIIRNISERARLEQMKSDFINRATHDLRTPLTTILLMVRLMEQNCTPEERDQYWKVLKEEVDRQRLMLEDFLMVGRLENNQWIVKRNLVTPGPILEDTVRSLQPVADSKNIELKLNISGTHLDILGDAGAMQQVFTNLLGNAIKFTQPGGQVHLTMASEGDKVWFTIQDNGMGIAQEDLPHMFLRFFRGSNAIENEVPGSGIGLYIVKSIIENFGGDIQVSSQLNKGTTFWFWLPGFKAYP